MTWNSCEFVNKGRTSILDVMISTFQLTIGLPMTQVSLKTTVEEGNFEHLFNFEANLKICQIFFIIFFSLKAKPKILLGVAKPFSMVLPPLVGLFLKNGRCSILPAHRLISNNTMYFINKFELRRQGGNIEHFQSFKKAGRTPGSFRVKKIW